MHHVWHRYWDRYDEGLFVGGTLVGSPMHVDQIIWSNVTMATLSYTVELFATLSATRI